ncbi:MAG: (d)CMP kinase [Deltaproteobacteria bacterium]|nr:(d)CMP kinase [Deltaproteobacteria bacterium]
MKKGPIVTIDGPSGSGKSTVARTVSERLGYRYIDTGAMYRGIGWLAREQKVPFREGPELTALLETARLSFEERDGRTALIVNGRDLTDRIRTAEMGMVASDISAIGSVRTWLSTLQRALGSEGKTVLEGRDMGTVVFPDAEVKIFLTASLQERARRRTEELKLRGEQVDCNVIQQDLARRDAHDRDRELAPLRKAKDALEIDTTSMTLNEVVNQILMVVRKKGAEGG